MGGKIRSNKSLVSIVEYINVEEVYEQRLKVFFETSGCYGLHFNCAFGRFGTVCHLQSATGGLAA